MTGHQPPFLPALSHHTPPPANLKEYPVSTFHRFLLGLALGATVTVIIRTVTGNTQLALVLGVAVLILVWLSRFVLDELL
ncbi:hypothetical protein C9F11_43090 (plasmid) [Streptomyces sp. YIM 121038]|nr:hypothetical protein C9F11_43090 [Streptomyces sp. YIM 121038]